MATPDEITGPINLGNATEITVRELAERVISRTGSRSVIVHRPLPEDDPRHRRPDLARAEATLGWKPSTPLDEGLAKTIAYFDELLASGRSFPNLSRELHRG